MLRFSTAAALLFALATMFAGAPQAEAAVISCAANCKTCYSALSTNCMSCDDNYFLDNF